MLKNSERLIESLHEVQRHESTITVFLVLKIIFSSSFLYFILFSRKKQFSFVVCFRSENNTLPFSSSCAPKSTISVLLFSFFFAKISLFMSQPSTIHGERHCVVWYAVRPPVRPIVRCPSFRPLSVIPIRSISRDAMSLLSEGLLVKPGAKYSAYL